MFVMTWLWTAGVTCLLWPGCGLQVQHVCYGLDVDCRCNMFVMVWLWTAGATCLLWPGCGLQV